MQKLNKSENCERINTVTELFTQLSKEITLISTKNVKLEDINTILSLLSTEVDKPKEILLNCIEVLSKGSTEQISYFIIFLFKIIFNK